MESGGVRALQLGLEALSALRKSVRNMRTFLRDRGESSTSVLIPILAAFLVVLVSETVSENAPRLES